MRTLNSKYKESITSYLEDFFDRKEKKLSDINQWGRDISARLRTFTTTGKIFRGQLAVLSYMMFRNRPCATIIQTAAAIEILHSAILIHDDIIDSDTFRRGDKAIFSQYSGLGQREKIRNPEHFGKGMGICSGDIGFYLAMEILAGLRIDATKKLTLITKFSREMTNVGLAEMQDLYLSTSTNTVNENDILNLYLYKTARYTCSLPFAAGALIADQPESTIQKLDKIGQNIGLIFQLADDTLGMFGEDNILGKPVGSDIREGKKTLFYLYLFQNVPDTQKKPLLRIFGKEKVTPGEMKQIRDAVRSVGADKKVDAKIEELARETSTSISRLDISDTKKKRLRDILRYSLERVS